MYTPSPQKLGDEQVNQYDLKDLKSNQEQNQQNHFSQIHNGAVHSPTSKKTLSANPLDQILNDKQRKLLNEIRRKSNTQTKRQSRASNNLTPNGDSLFTNEAFRSIQESFSRTARERSLIGSRFGSNPHNRLYEEHKMRKEKEREIENLKRSEARSQSNKSKFDSKSYRVLVNQIQNFLNDLISEVDFENNSQITFNQLGRVLTVLEVFRELQFDAYSRLQNNSNNTENTTFNNNIRSPEQNQSFSATSSSFMQSLQSNGFNPSSSAFGRNNNIHSRNNHHNQSSSSSATLFINGKQTAKEGHSYSQTKRKFEEMNLHQSLWRILKGEETINSEVLYCLLRILMDPVSISVQKTVDLFSEYLQQFEIDTESYDNPNQLHDFVVLWKHLVQDRLAQQSIRTLKPSQARQLLEANNEALTFAPQISPISYVYENLHTANFLYNNPVQGVDINEFVNRQGKIQEEYKNYSHQKQSSQVITLGNSNNNTNFNNTNNSFSNSQMRFSKNSFTENLAPGTQRSNSNSNNFMISSTGAGGIKAEQLFSGQLNLNNITPNVDMTQSINNTNNNFSNSKSHNINTIRRESLNKSATFLSSSAQQVDPMQRVKILEERDRLREAWLQREREREKYKTLQECTFSPDLSATKKINSIVMEQFHSEYNGENSDNNNNNNNNNGASSSAASGKPQVGDIVNRLYSHEEKKNRKIEEQQKRKEREQEIFETIACTFEPQTNHTTLDQFKNLIAADSSQIVRGFDKNVSRLRVGYEQKAKLKSQIEFIPVGEQYEVNQMRKENPPQMLLRKQNSEAQQNQVVQIHVNLGSGKKTVITLQSNDDPVQIAQNFQCIFQLDREIAAGLEDYLQNEIDALNDNQNNN